MDVTEAMKACEQTKGQTVWEHGQSVNKYLFDLLGYMRGGQLSLQWRLPSWVDSYRHQLLSRLLPDDTLSRYAQFHDCGKPFCRTVDQDGKAHFPDHAKASSDTWLAMFPDEKQIGDLILWDMDVHLMKADDIPDFCKRSEATSLLLTGLSEIHSNSSLFGGIESTSFKIKFKQVEKRGMAICKTLFKETDK